MWFAMTIRCTLVAVFAPDLVHQIAAIASLDEPVRRELYLYVAGRGREV